MYIPSNYWYVKNVDLFRLQLYLRFNFQCYVANNPVFMLLPLFFFLFWWRKTRLKDFLSKTVAPCMQSWNVYTWSKLSSGFTVTHAEAQPQTAVTDLAALRLNGPLRVWVWFVCDNRPQKSDLVLNVTISHHSEHCRHGERKNIFLCCGELVL